MAKPAERVRESCRRKEPEHWYRFKEWGGPGREFGLMNYPLPRRGTAARR